jgi:glycosyltransferase involved in cell wall biosynthesis
MARVPEPLESVGINALFLDPGRSGGPETYLRELVGAMVEEAPGTRFTIVTTRRGAAGLVRDGWRERASIVALPADEGERLRRQVAEQLLLPRLARRRGFDVLHSLASVAPIRAGVPAVITLHDTTFFSHRTFDAVTTFGMRQVVSRAAAHADGLLTGSAAARDDICRDLGMAPERFTVVPHGLGRPRTGAATPGPELRERLGLDGERLVICVAAKRPHKNQEVLVRAAPLLGDRTDVVLAGHPEAYDAELRRIAGEVGATRVRFADYVSDADLEGLWELADCAVFPTLAEGFGLPVLEAMSRGVPVACSDIPVLREVGGEAACYFDPHDPRSLLAAVTRATAESDARVPAGREQAAGFSWQAAAQATLAAYERASGKRLPAR